MEEKNIFNYEKLCNYYDNFTHRCRNDFWKEQVIEYIFQNFKEQQIDDMKLTYKTIDDIVLEILCEDKMWKKIDYTIADIVGKNIEKQIEKRIEEIKKQLKYCEERDKVSLSLNGEQEIMELENELERLLAEGE